MNYLVLDCPNIEAKPTQFSGNVDLMFLAQKCWVFLLKIKCKNQINIIIFFAHHITAVPVL